MEVDIACDDFLLSTSSKTGADYSCDVFKNKQPEKNGSTKCDLSPRDFITSSSSSSISTRLLVQSYCSKKEPEIKIPNISYELAVAKSIMQQLSSISGDNLFDHLSDVIKRVIDERPPNVIDFFEEFSRNVREQKLHLPERFPPEAIHEENRLFKVAKQQLISMKLPTLQSETNFQTEDGLEEEQSKNDIPKFDLKNFIFEKFRTFNDRVQHLQFYWNQCGLSISSEDIFQLACSMTRLQTHPSIMQCRFWGMINGLKASYYIVEATLTKDEYEARLLQMKSEMCDNVVTANMENENERERIKKKGPSHIGPELTPGAVGWEAHPQEDILKMKPSVSPVPLMAQIEHFDIPPEPIGKGVNRYSYFVVNSLYNEWTELPIVTPKQISQSRDIKKFFTGDLEEDIVSYPCFSGKEKHYLRAMIARITAGTSIAPRNYYRKMTKKERQLFESGENDGEEEEEDEESEIGEEEGDEEPDNDIILLKNENYNIYTPLNKLNNPEHWVHVRPNILLQGRVVWYDQEKAEREREKERVQLQKMLVQEEEDENDDEDDEEEEMGEEEEDIEDKSEKGPAILSACSRDVNSETMTPWVGRYTSKFTNQAERILVMQSNVWPGAHTFLFKDICESLYLGWGHKFVSRNMAWKHPPLIENEYKYELDLIEAADPTVQMEEEYKLSLLRKELAKIKDFDEDTVQESSHDEEGEDDDDEE